MDQYADDPQRPLLASAKHRDHVIGERDVVATATLTLPDGNRLTALSAKGDDTFKSHLRSIGRDLASLRLLHIDIRDDPVLELLLILYVKA